MRNTDCGLDRERERRLLSGRARQRRWRDRHTRTVTVKMYSEGWRIIPNKTGGSVGRPEVARVVWVPSGA